MIIDGGFSPLPVRLHQLLRDKKQSKRLGGRKSHCDTVPSWAAAGLLLRQYKHLSADQRRSHDAKLRFSELLDLGVRVFQGHHRTRRCIDCDVEVDLPHYRCKMLDRCWEASEGGRACWRRILSAQDYTR